MKFENCGAYMDGLIDMNLKTVGAYMDGLIDMNLKAVVLPCSVRTLASGSACRCGREPHLIRSVWINSRARCRLVSSEYRLDLASEEVSKYCEQ